jgi:hypothetical protein
VLSRRAVTGAFGPMQVVRRRMTAPLQSPPGQGGARAKAAGWFRRRGEEAEAACLCTSSLSIPGESPCSFRVDLRTSVDAVSTSLWRMTPQPLARSLSDQAARLKSDGPSPSAAPPVQNHIRPRSPEPHTAQWTCLDCFLVKILSSHFQSTVAGETSHLRIAEAAAASGMGVRSTLLTCW